MAGTGLLPRGSSAAAHLPAEKSTQWFVWACLSEDNVRPAELNNLLGTLLRLPGQTYLQVESEDR
jgi:hypothetical protein